MHMDFLIFFCVTLLPALYLLSTLRKFAASRAHQTCYILDYECFKPSDDRKLTTEICYDIMKRNKHLDLEDYQFLVKIAVRAGIGENTYAARNIVMGQEASPKLHDAISEMDEFFFTSIDNLLRKSQVAATEIDVLVLNVSTLTTVPSLSSRIINHYKMREDIKVYNLAGMGCSANLISIDVVRNVFKSRKNSLALIVSSESVSPNWYTGKNRSMLISNSLFRSGGCTILLTNNDALQCKAKLKLRILVCTHHGARDDSYNCCIQKNDEGGRVGYHLGKELPQVAARCLVDNLREMAPMILPVRELLRFVLALAIQKLNLNPKGSVTAGDAGAVKATVNFKTGVDHFCIHAGGKAVIDRVGDNMNLNEHDLEPSRMGLYRFGNTSVSSLWYVFAYMEAKKRLKRGNRVLMLSFGAGFLCNSCLWEVMRDLGDVNVWEHCIDQYPVKNMAKPFMKIYDWINNEEEVD